MKAPYQATRAVAGSVVVVESGDYALNGSQLQIPIGDNFAVQTGLLHEVCFTEISSLSRDLSVVLGAVKCADRSVRRQHGSTWSRHLKLTVPVYELSNWRKKEVVGSLTGALQYLTGDYWNFEFVKRRRKPESIGQVPLFGAPDRSRVFVPFSHGLDSFAQSELLKVEQAVDVIPVHLRSSNVERTLQSIGRASKRKLTPVSVSARVYEPKHAEPSFRTRPFLYDSLAAYASVLSGGGAVVIPENGQGSLGGSLVRLGAEAPHRSCHPGFTSRLSHFLWNLTGERVSFIHPALFKTKGEVLKELVDLRFDSDSWLSEHPSCSYDARHANREGKQVHCGLCGNCLLRRMSIHAAGIADPTPYKVRNLHANSLEEALVADDEVRSLHAYKDVGRNAGRSMQRLAEITRSNENYRVDAEVEGLARYQNRAVAEVREALVRMLDQHHCEWTKFLSYAGKSSWVAKLARG
ncbi:hypothetical protein [Variovorax sp.]|uniref:hypothetical protein n=1 Tax=Variovorax sp. TaxID=1871043 RepID=UPI003BA91576